jgi:hypothetical protein
MQVIETTSLHFVGKVFTGSSVEVLATEGLGYNLETATVTFIAEAGCF